VDVRHSGGGIAGLAAALRSVVRGAISFVSVLERCARGRLASFFSEQIDGLPIDGGRLLLIPRGPEPEFRAGKELGLRRIGRFSTSPPRIA